VLAVGGTTLSADSATGAYIGERAWADAFADCYPPDQFGCSGGGFSTLYGRPDYQDGVVGTSQRAVPDVAYNGGVDGGVLTHWGVGLATLGLDPTLAAFFIFGGTSAGSPQWSGLVAIADQMAGRRLGHMNRAIYRDGVGFLYGATLNDITSGNNNYDGVTGYQTGSAWDPVTGWGTPKASTLLPAVISLMDKKDDNVNY
jgi:subtilase family serine protease